MKKIDHSLLILRKNFENNDRSMYARVFLKGHFTQYNNYCTQYVWAWENFVNNLRCLLKILRSQQNLYAAAGRTGRDKYHLCYFGL